jgi:hypothetical protein
MDIQPSLFNCPIEIIFLLKYGTYFTSFNNHWFPFRCFIFTFLILLVTEVTPRLLAEAKPDAHPFLCHGLINGVIKWVNTQEDKTLTQ